MSAVAAQGSFDDEVRMYGCHKSAHLFWEQHFKPDFFSLDESNPANIYPGSACNAALNTLKVIDRYPEIHQLAVTNISGAVAYCKKNSNGQLPAICISAVNGSLILQFHKHDANLDRDGHDMIVAVFAKMVMEQIFPDEKTRPELEFVEEIFLAYLLNDNEWLARLQEKDAPHYQVVLDSLSRTGNGPA